MSESTSDLLTKVETALWLGDQRLAGMLLHKVLTQDFTNRQAWLLLHGMRGKGQTLEEFQHSFAGKYYPHLAHLLGEPPADSPAQTEAAAPDSLPVAALPGEMHKFCAVCGTLLLIQAKFCPYCGAPVTQAEEPATETPASPEAAQAAVDLSAETPETTDAPEAEYAGSEPREAFPMAGAGAHEPAEDTPEPRYETLEPLPEELDLLFKRATRLAPEVPAVETPEDATEDEPEPEPAERRPYCPTCHKIFSPEALFCDSCGAPLFQMVNSLPSEPEQASEQTPGQLTNAAPSPASAATPATAATPNKSLVQTPPGEGSLLIYRKKSPILEEITFSLWIDGEYRDDIGNHQKRVYTLPAGAHTIEMVSEQRSSDPITIDLPAKGTVRITCQPVGTSPEIIRPELKVIPTKAAAGTNPKDRQLPLGLRILLLALLFLIFMVGIGMIVLFLINQGVL